MDWDSLLSERARRLEPSRLSAIMQSRRSTDVISLAGGAPDPELLPVERIRAAADVVLSERGGEALSYGNGQGIAELREFIAQRMSTEFMRVDPDNIIITSGSQQGIDLVGRALLNDGDRVLVRNPTYMGMLNAWRGYRLDWQPIYCGGETDDLDQVMQPRPKLMYFVTDFENPTGEVFPPERRASLVKALAQYQVPALEDDPYGQLRYDGEPVPTLLEFDAQQAGSGAIGGHVIYAGSFSKVLSPGLRVGWLVADKPLVTRLMQIKQGANLCSSIFDQFVAYEASRDGFLDENIAWLRTRYAERRDAMIAALERYFPPEVTFTRPEGGFFILVTLPESMDSVELLKRAVQRDVVFIPGESLHIQGAGSNTLRLSFSRYKPEILEQAIERLAEVIKEMLAEHI
ncbi:MAG TPA: PLP-dependent aminotransferase family protein [Spirillospora sp.]|nr:PLP-dependent aminotransferase family protein [Spirillospora sp.]